MSATVAAPIARNILEDAVAILNIKKRTNGISKEYRYFDTKYQIVENVVGMSVKEARDKLKDFQVEYSGTGNKVVSMAPEAGSSIPVGSIVRLMLEKE